MIIVTPPGKSTLILGENKAAFRREGHIMPHIEGLQYSEINVKLLAALNLGSSFYRYFIERQKWNIDK